MIQCIQEPEVFQQFCNTRPVSPLIFPSLSTLPSLSLAKEWLEERYDAKRFEKSSDEGTPLEQTDCTFAEKQKGGKLHWRIAFFRIRAKTIKEILVCM